jgi:hypothetical protein
MDSLESQKKGLEIALGAVLAENYSGLRIRYQGLDFLKLVFEIIEGVAVCGKLDQFDHFLLIEENEMVFGKVEFC